MKKIFSALLVLILAGLVVIGGLTVFEKSKTALDKEKSTIQSISRVLSRISALFGGVSGVYNCEGNLSLIKQLEFNVTGSGTSKNILNKERTFNYFIVKDVITMTYDNGTTDVFKVGKGEIILPLNAKCVR